MMTTMMKAMMLKMMGKPSASVNAVPSGCQGSQGISPKYVNIEPLDLEPFSIIGR